MQNSATSTDNLYAPSSPGVAGPNTVAFGFDIIVYAYFAVMSWKIFTKAGKPGWAALVPIYNILVLLEIIGRPWWWILLMLVPLINLGVLFVVCLDMAKVFGKGALFGIFGLAIFPVVGYPILAFGPAQYMGKGGSGSTANPGSPVSPTPPPSTPPITTPPAGTAGV